MNWHGRTRPRKAERQITARQRRFSLEAPVGALCEHQETLDCWCRPYILDTPIVTLIVHRDWVN